MRWARAWLLILFTLSACDGAGGSITRGDGGAAAVDAAADGGDEAGADGGTADGGTADGGAADGGGPDGCAPATCPPDACGARPDGCGGVLDCQGGCACQGDGCPCDDDAGCAQRPCEVGRCEAGACAYAPVACAQVECACEVEPCDDAAPRRCGAGCDAQVCDPSPDGRGGFLNRCVPIEALPCGACGVATSACDPETGAVTCDDLIPVEVAQGRTCEQLVLFVDPDYDGPQRGTREAPFSDLAAALDLAALAGAPLVVVGGSGELPGPVTLRDGVTLRGGYSGHPWFQPSDDRPTVRAAATAQAVDNGQLVALVAQGVVTEGAVQGLDLVVDGPPPPEGAREDGVAGVHTLGVLAVDSPALVLTNVDITVASAGAGWPGADAEPVEADLDPALMDGAPGIDAPGALGAGGCDELYNQVCDAFPGCAMPCNTPNPLGPVIPGARGAWGAVCPADLDGVRSQTQPGGPAGQLVTVCEGLVPGTRPAWPEDQINRRAGAPGAVGGALDDLGRWHSLGTGVAGLPGVGGRPGAGGTSDFFEGCHFGASGGGGGAGGCGGFGGRPGGGGGAAVALLAVRSTGLSLVDVTATVGDGGAGAPGGLGSAGLPGGQGGAPGLDPYGGVSRATAGEAGGAGHPGGPGGNGAGGDSAGVLCVQTTLDAPAEAFTVGLAGAGADAHGDLNAAPAPAGRAAALVGCSP